MSASEGAKPEQSTPGLGQLGKRLLAGAILMMALILLVGRWGEGDRQNRESFPSTSGTIRISGLSTPVEILRDAHGIPHVNADSEAGGWFGLGFAHGQDRLAQMARLRRRAHGRSAEILGEKALRVDRLARILEIEVQSREVAAALPAKTREILEAYASGVNARIARIRQDRVEPPRWLSESPADLENWQPADSIAIGKLLSWCMGGTLETTLVLDELIQRLDSVPARPFFPGGASVDFGVASELPRSLPPDSARSRLHEITEGQPTRSLCHGIGIPTGATWVVDGAVTESGSPIIVADWHIAPSVPALFYEAEVDAGPVDVAGVTIPGSPIFWAGRNRQVAWAGVPASAPVADLFIETLRESRGEYQNGLVWAPLEERQEILRYRDVRSQLVDEPLTIRRTRHGPLIEALFERGSVAEVTSPEVASVERSAGIRPSARALSWTGARPGDGMTSMLGLLRAANATEMVSSLATHHEPVLAVAFADREGAGGVQVAGWLPKRPLPTGLVPVQGRLRSFDWREAVPQDELPALSLGEEAGNPRWVVAADQPWSSRAELDQMEWLWRSGERAARLRVALEARVREGAIDLRSVSELVHDDFAQRAPRVVAGLLALARSQGRLPQEAEEIAQLIEPWDGSMGAGSSAAAAYHLVIEHLLDQLLRAPFGETLFAQYLSTPHMRPQHAIESLVLRAASLRRAGGWTDEKTVATAARASLRGAWVSLNHRLGPTRERWAWGGLHRLRFRPMGRERSLSGPLARAVAMAGDGQTLSYASHRPGLDFDVDQVGAYRVAMDLSSTEHLLSALVPGQSEHPGHPHFADGLGRWAATRLPLFATNRLVIEEETSQRLVLEPAP